MLETGLSRAPVIVIGYNRPDTTRTLLTELRHHQIDHLLVILDGPKDTEEDRLKCKQVSRLVKEIDWVRKKDICASKTNMGLRERIVSGLDWAFSRVNEAIILEDDCIPARSFIDFCNHGLQKYRSDKKIWTICGQNLQNGRKIGDGSYYLSSYAHCWGWATWKDRWDKNTFRSTGWSLKVRDSDVWNKRFKMDERMYWEDIFSAVEMERIRSWAYQWQACIWMNNGSSITPNVNLVSNIGFSEAATNTCNTSSVLNRMETGDLDMFVDPLLMDLDPAVDRYVFEWVYLNGTSPKLWVIKRIFKRILKYMWRLRELK